MFGLRAPKKQKLDKYRIPIFRSRGGWGRELCFVKFISPHATEIITELFQGDAVSLPALMSSRFPLLHFASRCRER